MAENTLEYILSLQDHISGPLKKIGINNSQQLATWAAVEKQVNAASATMKSCGISIGSLNQRISALQAEKQWIPASNTNAIKVTNIEIAKLEKQMHKLDSVGSTGIKKWVGQLKQSVPVLNSLTNPILMIGASIYKLNSYVNKSVALWEEEIEAQRKLAVVMNNTIGASQGEIDSILKLTEAQQKLGVINTSIQKAGAQELATYVSKTSSLEKLIPVMNDMLVQQYGLNASQQQAANIATMMGKVLDGQVGGLSRYGYTFDAAQEHILKFGTEVQRATVLAEVIKASVGGMNEAMALTPEGKLKQYENSMGDVQNRIGKLYNEIKMTLFPLFEAFNQRMASLVGWFEKHQQKIETFVKVIGSVISGVFSAVLWTVGAVVNSFKWFFNKLREGNIAVYAVTAAVVGLSIAINRVTLVAKLNAIWAGILTAKTVICTTWTYLWAAAQNALNLSFLANPVTWVILGIVALIAAITWVIVKVDGLSTIWEAAVGFMKNTFFAYVEGVKLYFTTMINGIMIGIDAIIKKWYEFKDAVGIGDPKENQAAINAINKRIEDRQKQILDSANKVKQYTKDAIGSWSKINLSINNKSLGDVAGGIKKSLGLNTGDTLQNKINAGSSSAEGGTLSKTNESIATGGTRTTNITINIQELARMIFNGGITENKQNIKQEVEDALLQAINIANTTAS